MREKASSTEGACGGKALVGDLLQILSNPMMTGDVMRGPNGGLGMLRSTGQQLDLSISEWVASGYLGPKPEDLQKPQRNLD